MTKQHEHAPGKPEHDESNRGEALSGAWEKGQEFAEKWSERDDKKVIHCPKCQGAEKAQKISKATMLFSLGAFVMSLAALVLPFLRTTETGFSTEQWDTFLTTLQDGMKVSEQVKPAAARPTVTQPKSSAAPKPVSSAATVSSQSPASSEAASSAPAAAGSVQTVEPSVTGERPAP